MIDSQLTVDDCRREARIAPKTLAVGAHCGMMHSLRYALGLPAAHIVVDGPLGRKSCSTKRQASPRPRSETVAFTGSHVATLQCRPPGEGHQVIARNRSPLGVGEVSRIESATSRHRASSSWAAPCQ